MAIEDRTLNSSEITKYMGTSYIVANQEKFEPGRQSDFIMKVKFKRDLYDTNGVLVAKADEATEQLALSIKNFTGPAYTLEKIPIRTGNGVVNYAGAPSLNDGSISFTDYIGAKTEAILFAWYCMAHNPVSDKIGFKEYYAQDSILYKWAPNGTRQVSWWLKGCWLNSWNIGTLDKSNPTQRELSTTIVYDRCEPYATSQQASWNISSNDKQNQKTSAAYNTYSVSNYLGTLGTDEKN